jgi:hypothetical protein
MGVFKYLSRGLLGYNISPMGGGGSGTGLVVNSHSSKGRNTDVLPDIIVRLFTPSQITPNHRRLPAFRPLPMKKDSLILYLGWH